MLFTIVDICQLAYLYYKKLLMFKKRNWAIRFSSLSFLVLMVVYMSQSGFKRINYCYCKSNNLLSAVTSHWVYAVFPPKIVLIVSKYLQQFTIIVRFHTFVVFRCKSVSFHFYMNEHQRRYCCCSIKISFGGPFINN